MHAEFADTPPRDRRGGHGRVDIPAEIVGWLDQTYSSGRALMVPLTEDHEEAPAFLRMLRIHARHRNLAVDYEFTGDGRLKFRMRDKRSYGKPDLKEATAA